MNTKQKQLQHQKRRLDRRNANRNIDYDASPSESYSPLESPQSPFRIQALDDDQTSFRIQGTEGEFDRICSYLGLSGPDDFAIPTAAWEASKARSYHFPSSRFVTRHNSVKLGVSESIVDGLSDAIEAQISASEKLKHENERLQLKNGSNQASIEASVRKFGEPIEDGLADAFEAPIRVSGKLNDHNGLFQLNSGVNPAEIKAMVRNIDGVRHGYHESRLSVRCIRDGGCGIKGTRPPLLAPPPAISQVVRDNVSSTWDIFRSFGPQDEELCSADGLGLTTRLSKEEDREIEEDDEGDGNIVSKSDMDRALLRHNSVVPESCWDTTNDDISFHTITMEPLYCILPNGKSKRSIKCWQKGDFLGSGSFGTVYEGFTDDGLFFAVKEVSLLDQGSQGKQSILQLEQEISLLSKFKHENIVQYLGTDKDDSKLYIFLELVTKGSLANLYQKYHLRDSQVCAYTRQILNGLNYLHCLNVVHRDIKCANILVDASGSVKLADFGLAKATKLNDIKSCKGTAFWMAPEVVNQKNRGYGLAADIWSLGCTVLEMLTCKIPYYHLEGMQALFRIGKGELPLIPSSLSIDAQDFIYKCLQVIPDDRPTAAELLDHSFVKRSLSSSLGPPSPFHNGTRGLKAFTSL